MKKENNEFFAELDAQKSQAGKEHGGGCVFLAFYFILIYTVMVIAFWQLGNVTHQTNRGLSDLYQAQNLQDIRDALAEKFGSFSGVNVPSIDDITSDIKEDVTDAVTEKIKEEATQVFEDNKEQIIKEATNDIGPQ